jgi:tetratricopeptide (TPR) repeat protein
MKISASLILFCAYFLSGCVVKGGQPLNGTTNVSSATSEHHDTDAAQYLRAGISQIKTRNYDQALHDIDNCLMLDSSNAEALVACGYIYVVKNDLDTALFYYSESIRLQPTNATTYLDRGSLYRAKGQFDHAITDFTDCLRQDKTSVNAYKSRASAYTALGKYQSAVEDLTASLAISTNDVVALVMRADDYCKFQQYDKARGDYERSIAISPSNADGCNDFAWFLATCPLSTMRNGPKAVQLATTACNLTAWSRWQYIDTVAVAFAENHDFDKAIQVENDVLSFPNLDGDSRKGVQERILLFKNHQAYHE